MKLYKSKFFYEHPWSDVSMAQWLKYPNPFASHVISSDTIERKLTPDGRLHSTRIFLKTGNVPKWGFKIMKNNYAYIIEESVVDPVERVMITKTKNLSHRGIMAIEETLEYKPHEDNSSWTLVNAQARIVSSFGWGITNKIEQFGLKRFGVNIEKSREGMKWVLEQLHRRREQLHQFVAQNTKTPDVGTSL
ncbi:hypothetical protein MIR68_007491 [Amoeboaphelidium protococcarum]|nr:hypothetical protein MIR68_007491 [Amoeboaphelidium protococcarum]KAI3642018.1 hypothetical protein MP228_011573 [Amoeboaphelidium protococcarum]KAI3647260.1 hypothetical protein MP228_007481 [Amoeboaphelidium protococcarum]